MRREMTRLLSWLLVLTLWAGLLPMGVLAEGELPEENPEEITEQVPEETPEEPMEELAEEIQEETPEQIPEETSEEIPEETPEVNPAETQEEIQEEETVSDEPAETASEEPVPEEADEASAEPSGELAESELAALYDHMPALDGDGTFTHPWDDAYEAAVLAAVDDGCVLQLADIDLNGVPELLIGSKTGTGLFSIVRAMYTFEDGAAAPLTDGNTNGQLIGSNYRLYRNTASGMGRLEADYSYRDSFFSYFNGIRIYALTDKVLTSSVAYYTGYDYGRDIYRVGGEAYDSQETYDAAVAALYEGWEKSPGDFVYRTKYFSAMPTAAEVRAFFATYPETVMELSIGPKLENGEYAELTRIMGISDLRCEVEVPNLTGAWLTDFLKKLTPVDDDWDGVLEVIRRTEEVSEDGQRGCLVLRLRPLLKENAEPMDMTLRVESGSGLAAELDTKVSNGLIALFTYRTDGKSYKNTITYDAGGKNKNSGNAAHEFYYCDDYFYGANTGYNNALAVLSLGMELTAFSDPRYDDQYTSASLLSGERAGNIIEACRTLDFQGGALVDYDISLGSSEDKAAVTIGKKYIADEEHNDTLLTVIIRGGGYGAEWASNFKVGSSGDSEGFASAAAKIVTELESQVKILQESKDYTGELKVWITGFSRGAAVADIVAHRLNSGAVSGLSGSNIYAYTFATPNNWYSSAVGSGDGNVFNIVSPNDLVPRMPLVGWGFTKYGVTLTLPETRNEAVGSAFRQLTGDTFEGWEQADKLDGFIGDLRSLAPGRSDYYDDAQENVTEAFRKEYEKGPGSMVLAFIRGMMVSYGLNVTKLLSALQSKLTFVHYPEHYLAWLETGGTHALGSGYARLTNEERERVGQAMWDLFDQPIVHFTFWTRGMTDITVVGSAGGTIAGVSDGRATSGGGVSVTAEGDRVDLYLPKNDTYRLEVTGTGSLSYTAYEYDGDHELVREVCYWDIPMSGGTSLTGTVTPALRDPAETYGLSGGATTAPTLDTLTDAAETHTVTVNGGISSRTFPLTGETVELTAEARDGMVFAGWTSDAGTDIFGDASAAVTWMRAPDRDVTVTANYRESTALKGDCNGDGKVNRQDRVYLARHLAGWDGYETVNETAADVDENGKVNRQDRVHLARALAGWESYKL